MQAKFSTMQRGQLLLFDINLILIFCTDSMLTFMTLKIKCSSVDLLHSLDEAVFVSSWWASKRFVQSDTKYAISYLPKRLWLVEWHFNHGLEASVTIFNTDTV